MWYDVEELEQRLRETEADRDKLKAALQASTDLLRDCRCTALFEGNGLQANMCKDQIAANEAVLKAGG